MEKNIPKQSIEYQPSTSLKFTVLKTFINRSSKQIKTALVPKRRENKGEGVSEEWNRTWVKLQKQQKFLLLVYQQNVETCELSLV